MAANVVLDTVTIVPGGETTISGNISGTLAGDTLYYVSDDLTVPSGETLTIAAGAQVLFQGDYNLTANGTLLVNGSANNRVVFTSGNLVKATGDWGGIIINKSGSRVSYADIQYSSSAVYVSDIDTVTINNCIITNNTSGIAGIRILDGADYFTIRENTIRANFSYGIRKINSSGDNSCSTNHQGGAEIVGNTIYALYGMYICGTYNAQVDSNTILLEDNYSDGTYGIDNENGRYSNYNGNLILAQNDGFYYHGFKLLEAIIQSFAITKCVMLIVVDFTYTIY
jgi:hypothetical protein